MPLMPPISSNSSSTIVQQDNFPKGVWCYCKQPENDKAMIGCDTRTVPFSSSIWIV